MAHAFFFVGGFIALAAGILAGLYYVGRPAKAEAEETGHEPAKRHILSHWR